MAGSQRYFRYILFAVLALVVIFFISASSGVGPGQGYTQKASDLLKGQGSLYQGSGSNSVPAGGAPDAGQDSKVGSGSGSNGDANPTLDSDVKSAAAPQHTDPSSLPPSTNPHDTTSPNPNAPSLHAGQTPPLGQKAPGPRMNATFVTLARNSDVWEISRSIRQVEDRFNHAYNYDWVFLNDADFDDTFIKVTTALTSGKTRYGKIASEHWGFPSFIDQEKARKVREDMHERKIIYGDSVSYRHMCRYESGFFFRHPIMLEYEWYWRVEPSIELFCDVSYDPFKFMADNKKKYSFVLSLYEYVETIPTLWDSVKGFMKAHPEHIVADNSLAFLSDDGGESYNHCHFWSNFEVGNLDWLRSKAYVDYFDHLDRDGGFFYERWGDAPVHSIAAGLMLKKEEIHFFNDIAYYHVPFTHCPTGEQVRLDNKCHCNPKNNFDWNGYSCTKRFFEVNKLPLPEGYEKEQ
ncbi:Alpha-1,2 mannosyltransferase KTR1 [Friedmanniomyces simplex]|uniref:Alpha-1,2 mannosyltransferase KTR1 n=1 Tax=Friedmanniomyces simplex TaxID=329884 RepID=A0A4U0WGW7_9PEZI|nr:Alpha-1,2 mannosyltransferase KTR1 [Friedmanniomyces simplex]